MKKLLLILLSAVLLFSFSACGGMMDDGRFRKIVGKGGETYKVQYKELYDGVNALYMIDKKKRVVSVQIGAETDGSLETASLDYREDGRLKQMNYTSAAFDVGYFCYYVYNGDAAPERYELYKDGDLLAKASLDFDGEIGSVTLTEEGKGLIFMPYYNAKTETFSHVFFDEKGKLLPDAVRVERKDLEDGKYKVRFYDENGVELLSELFLENGLILNSNKYTHDENGMITKDEFFILGKPDQISYYKYDENGRRINSAVYENGGLIYTSDYEYDENSVLLFENCFDPHGMPYKKNEYGKKGTIEKSIVYYPNTDKVYSVTLYDENERITGITLYRQNGTLFSVTDFDNAGSITKQIFYDEKGKPEP